MRWLSSVTTACLQLVTQSMVLCLCRGFKDLQNLELTQLHLIRLIGRWSEQVAWCLQLKWQKKLSIDNNKYLLKHNISLFFLGGREDNDDSTGTNFFCSYQWLNSASFRFLIFLEKCFSILERILLSFFWSLSHVEHFIEGSSRNNTFWLVNQSQFQFTCGKAILQHSRSSLVTHLSNIIRAWLIETPHPHLLEGVSICLTFQFQCNFSLDKNL